MERNSIKQEVGGLVTAVFVILCFAGGVITYREGVVGFHPSKAVGLVVGIGQAFAEVVKSVETDEL